MPRRWTNAYQQAGGYRLHDLENELHRKWETRQQHARERRLGIPPKGTETA